MNKLVLLVLSLTSLVVAQQEQPHLNPRDLITPIAAIQPRATGLGDCQASFKSWETCAGKGLDSSLCGLDLTNTKQANIDSSCACNQATALYNCYTSYCTTGTEYSNYYVGVSACAAIGYGSPPPAPTGAAAGGGGGGKPNIGSPAGGELGLWTLGIGLVFGTFVVMVL